MKIDCDTALMFLAAADENALGDDDTDALTDHLRECETCALMRSDDSDDSDDGDEPAAEDGSMTATTVSGRDEVAVLEPVALPVVDPATYDWDECIGRGGMGKISRVRDRRLDREVAIKEAVGGHRRLRFEREALITARLQHPAIVPVYEAGTWPNGAPFYTMKMVAGDNLADVIARTETLNERIGLLPKVITVAEALAYAHAQRIIHRDLKPDNVLVGEFGETVVIDWGLAKQLSDASPDERTSAPYRDDDGLTIAGEAFGTPRYMPPEQARGELVDERADVYAIGAMLYHVLAGSAPYSDTGARGRDVLALALTEPPTPLAQLQPDTPPDLLAIVAKAMARDPNDRYPNAGALAADLERFQTGQLVTARNYSSGTLIRRWLARHKAGVTIATAVVAFLGVGGAISVNEIRSERDRAQTAFAEAKREGARAKRRSIENQNLLAEVRTEQGRTELLAGRPVHAAVYLKAAYGRKQTDETQKRTPTQLMLGHALRSLEAQQAVLDTDHRIVGVFFDHAQRAIAALRIDGDLVLRDAATGQLIHRLPGTGKTERIVPSPNGRRLLLLGGDTSLWSTGGDAPIARFGRRPDAPRAGWFDPSGRVLALATASGEVQLLDAHTGALKQTLQGHKNGARALGWRADGRELAVLDRNLSACVYGIDGKKVRCANDGREWRKGARFIALGPDGEHVVRAGGQRISLLDVKHGTGVHFYSSTDITALALSHDGRFVAVGNQNGYISLYELPLARVWTTRSPGHGAAVSSLAFSQDDSTILSGGADWTARLWDRRSGAPKLTLAAQPGGRAWKPVIDRSGKHVLVRSGTRAAYLWNTTRTILRASLEPGARAAIARWRKPGLEPVLNLPSTLAIGRKIAPRFEARELAPAHDYLLTATMNAAAVQLWRVETGELIANLKHNQRGVTAAVFSPDGRYLATVDRTQRAHIYDGRSGAHERTIANVGHATSVAISHDNAKLAVGDMTGTVRLWSVHTGERVAVLQKHEGSASVSARAFSPDGRRLVSAGTNGTLKIWDPAAGTLVQELAGHASAIRQAFFHDNALLITATRHEAKLWRRRAGSFTLASTIQDRKRAMGRVTVNRDASLISTVSKSLVTIWDAARGEPVARLDGTIAAFSNDGTEIATRTEHALLIWEAYRPDPMPRWPLDIVDRAPYRLRNGRFVTTRRAAVAPTFVVPGQIIVPEKPKPW